MTTDNGIDLVAYAPNTARPRTIQVKTNHVPKLAGGKGKPALDWWVDRSSPAELVALVDVESHRSWLFWHGEVAEFAQQCSSRGLHFYMYTDSDYLPRRQNRHVRDFDDKLLNRRRIEELFNIAF